MLLDKLKFSLMTLLIIFGVNQLSHAGVSENDLVTQIDDPHIQIGSNFFGEELLVFGAMSGQDLSKSDIIIKVEGKPKSLSVREKVNKYGIWINDSEMLIDNIPSFYAIYSNRNINRITSENLLKEQRIGISSLNFVSDFDTEKSKIINQAIIKKNKEKGIFTEKFTGIRIIGDKLFRSSIQLPQDIKEGTYEVSIYFFEDQQLVDNDVSNVFVNKTQSGKFIYNQANENPLLYGVFSVLIAWAAGLIVAGISRVR
jgi:uncharacterized protein (TIGR02186 family)